jgi:magnesium-transporting ATPase (P-type)
MKVGAFLGELVTLLELYVLTLLAPGPFNAVAISMIGLFGAVSCALAYFSSSLFRNPADMKHLRLVQIIAKPPFVIWIVTVVIISFQLANGLTMIYLANRK